MLRSGNKRFGDSLDYHSYDLADKSSKYVERVAKSVAKWAKQLQVQGKTNILELFNPVLITGVLSTFKLVCDTNGIQKGSAMWLLPFFMEKTVAAALNPIIALC